MVTRNDPQSTLEAQAKELADLDARIRANEAKSTELAQAREVLHKRRQFVATRVARQRLQASINGYVKLIGESYGMEPKTVLKPTVGAIGRVVRVGRTRALIDFGEDLHTWYVPLMALGTVSDPLAEGIRDDPIIHALDQQLESLHLGLMQYDELTDQERWEDEQSS